MNGLLLVGHGSRSPESVKEMHELAGLVAVAIPDVRVNLGFLEMTDPPAGVAFDDLADQGCEQVVVLPLMLLGAGHSKSDVPAVVWEARERHSSVDVRMGSPLGVSHTLVGMLGEAVVGAGGHGLPLLVIARGTSDPDANGDASKAARLVAEWTSAPFVHTAFSGVTVPPVPDGLDVFARLGHRQMAVAFWFLCSGALVQRARDDVAAFAGRTGVTVVDAGYFGPDERLAAIVVDRYRQAQTGDRPAVNCDLCAYRAAWPGKESRVAQSIGVGHSHLAVEHRH